jgi:hypothetical protein
LRFFGGGQGASTTIGVLRGVLSEAESRGEWTRDGGGV